MNLNINAKSLKSSSLIRKELDEEVKNILISIKDAIIYANKSGYTYTEYYLPPEFPLISLNGDLIKLYIYSHVINKIKIQHFNVKFNIDKKNNKYVLYINWSSIFSLKEINKMKSIINNVTENHI